MTVCQVICNHAEQLIHVIAKRSWKLSGVLPVISKKADTSELEVNSSLDNLVQKARYQLACLTIARCKSHGMAHLVRLF
jgi:hypothetical protein